jgi:hypothetical protein
MDDILALDDGLEDEKAFLAVRQISEAADLFYRNAISPWIRGTNNDLMAETMRQLHPLRMERYLLSDRNPLMAPVKATAARIKQNGQRKAVADDNPFRAWEKLMSDMIVDGLNLYRDARDAACEMMFQAIYESPGMKLLADFAGSVAPRNDRQLEELRRQDAGRWRKHMMTGEFPDAMVRIFLAIGFADHVVRRKGYAAISRLFAENPRMDGLGPEDIRQIIREQSRIIQTDADQAIATLPHLLAGAEDRRDALAMLGQAVATIGRELAPQERAVLESVKTVLAA